MIIGGKYIWKWKDNYRIIPFIKEKWEVNQDEENFRTYISEGSYKLPRKEPYKIKVIHKLNSHFLPVLIDIKIIYYNKTADELKIEKINDEFVMHKIKDEKEEKSIIDLSNEVTISSYSIFNHGLSLNGCKLGTSIKHPIYIININEEKHRLNLEKHTIYEEFIKEEAINCSGTISHTFKYRTYLDALKNKEYFMNWFDKDYNCIKCEYQTRSRRPLEIYLTDIKYKL